MDCRSLVLNFALSFVFLTLCSTSTNTVQAADSDSVNEYISHHDNHLNLQEILETEQLTKDKHSRRDCIFDPNHIDYRMLTTELIAQEGYPQETHYVTTEDGYIFQVHRIPQPGKPVVYALHGLFSSSRDFLMNCKGRALAYKLYNSGYDVWLGNFRGNAYGINHTTLDTKSREFWKFSIDEVIGYDGPAAVNYILKETGQEKLTWIGHSLGNAVLFGMLASRTEFNDKINLGVSLGTSIYLGNTKSTVLKLTSMVQRIIESFVFTFWKGEVFPRNLFQLYHFLVPRVCQRAAVMDRPGFCAAMYFLLDGRDPAQFNNVYIPFAVGGVPSSTSARIAGQGLQWIATGKFTKYDFGHEKNKLKYGTLEPPAYNLTNVIAPILNFWADNDFVTSKADVLQAVTQLPNVIENVRVNWTNWNHIDYLYGKDADILVYDHIIQVLDSRLSKPPSTTTDSSPIELESKT